MKYLLLLLIIAGCAKEPLPVPQKSEQAAIQQPPQSFTTTEHISISPADWFYENGKWTFRYITKGFPALRLSVNNYFLPSGDYTYNYYQFTPQYSAADIYCTVKPTTTVDLASFFIPDYLLNNNYQ